MPGQDPPLTFTRFGGVQPPQVNVQVDQAPEPEKRSQSARFSELEDFKTQFFASQYQLQFQPRNGQLRLGVTNPLADTNRQNRVGNLEEKPQVVQNGVQQEYGPPSPPQNNDERDQVEEISEDQVSFSYKPAIYMQYTADL